MNAVVESRPREVVAADPPSSPLQMIQAALEAGRDLATIEKLMDLSDRWEAKQAEKAYTAAITEFKRNPPTIMKDKHVLFTTSKGTTEYDHATLGAVCDAAIKGLAAVGISHRWETEQTADGWIVVTCVLTHELGHSERTTLRARPDDSGGKNSIQSIGSAVTYLSRYTLLGATGLATNDQDNDGRGAGPETITAEQVADLEALATEVGANLDGFRKYLRVERLADLPASKYRAAVAALEAKRK